MTDTELLELLKGEFVLDIPNFTKHNNGKTTSWLKLRHDWFDDSRVSRLSVSGRYLWVVLLSLRGTSGKPLDNLTLTSLQHRVNLRGASCVVQLVSMWKLGLVSIERGEREERSAAFHAAGEGIEGRGPATAAKILPGLEGVDREALEQIPIAAQQSWVNRFGVEVVRRLVPTAHAAWKIERPGPFGSKTPLATKILRYLEAEGRFADRKPQKQKTWEDLLEEAQKKKREEQNAKIGV